MLSESLSLPKNKLMNGGIVNKLRNALANTVILFLIMVVISAVLAVFVHSVVFLPAWASFVLGSFALLFITMLALEYSKEKNDD